MWCIQHIRAEFRLHYNFWGSGPINLVLSTHKTTLTCYSYYISRWYVRYKVYTLYTQHTKWIPNYFICVFYSTEKYSAIKIQFRCTENLIFKFWEWLFCHYYLILKACLFSLFSPFDNDVFCLLSFQSRHNCLFCIFQLFMFFRHCELWTI